MTVIWYANDCIPVCIRTRSLLRGTRMYGVCFASRKSHRQHTPHAKSVLCPAALAKLVMGRVALWPGRRPESIAVGRFRSQEFSQEFEDVAFAVLDHLDHRSTCSKSARSDRRLSAHRPWFCSLMSLVPFPFPIAISFPFSSAYPLCTYSLIIELWTQ